MLHQNRRTFLKTSSMALASAAFLPNLELKKKKIVGVQLYSVRADMKTDPLSTLKEIANMGYKYVEHANYVNRKFYGWSATEFKKVLDDLGLKMLSGHTVMGNQHWDDTQKDFTDVWKNTVEDAAICGQKYVISPSLPTEWRKTQDILKKYMDIFNKSGELCQKSGMKFGYHNHHFEFAEKLDGVTVFDIIMKNTDPKLVAQQLDIGNMYNGGAKAQDILTQYPKRFELMHVKDEVAAPAGGTDKYESTVLGVGVINVKEVVDLGKKMGNTTHFIIEQESYQGKKPLDSVKEDLAMMKKWGY